MEPARSRVLLIYYSHSGEAGRVADALVESLRCPGVDVVVKRVRPVVEYPLPWRSIATFFGILPECHLGPLPKLEPTTFDSQGKFDLVILVYQVWFLAPSLPMQSFLQSEAAKVLRNTKVITVSVSRNMWHCASETMKILLQAAGARHIDHVSLTHQGSALATLITTPRALLFGKKEGFWGIFPRVGISDAGLARVTQFGETMLNQLEKRPQSEDAPWLAGMGAVHVNRRYVVPELIGWYWFRGWARLIRWLGRWGRLPRLAGVYSFVVGLVFMIVVVLPLTLLIRLVLFPLMNRWTASYIKRLEQPSGP